MKKSFVTTIAGERCKTKSISSEKFLFKHNREHEVKEDQKTFEIINDRILSTILNPNSEIIIGENLFTINLPNDKVSVYNISENCSLKSTDKGISVNEFSCSDNEISLVAKIFDNKIILATFKIKTSMKKIVLLVFAVTLGVSCWAADGFYLSTGAGYSRFSDNRQGAGTDFILGYKPNKWIGLGLTLNSAFGYRELSYAYYSKSATHAGVGLQVSVLPLRFGKNELELTFGATFGNYQATSDYFWVDYEKSSTGQVLIPSSSYQNTISPVAGINLYHRYRLFDVGFGYLNRHFSPAKHSKTLNNQQVMIRIRKEF